MELITVFLRISLLFFVCGKFSKYALKSLNRIHNCKLSNIHSKRLNNFVTYLNLDRNVISLFKITFKKVEYCIKKTCPI